jgi:hypothetical protein
MKKILFLLPLLLALSASAQTNVLQLTWQQPPGWHSDLYSSTNVNGGWSLLSTNAPDVSVVATQSQACFTVIVSPPVQNGVCGYTNDPTAEGVRPLNTNQPAFAIGYFNSSELWWWIVADQQWE